MRTIRRPDRRMRNFNIDAGGVRARRLIDKALAGQAAAAADTQ
jgi:vanillate O-demethylase monooxygenase subunit